MCRVEGVLERVAGVIPIHEVHDVREPRSAFRSVPEKARKLLEKAEHLCLISNSVNGEPRWSPTSRATDVTVAG